MPTITFDKFDAGLDVRRSADTSGANQFRTLTNAYVSTGKQIKKRQGFVKVYTLEAGTKGLRAISGSLHTFSAASVPHANTFFVNNAVPWPVGGKIVSKVHYADSFNGFVYASVEYTDGSIKHHYLDGTFPPAVTDVNCPHSRSVVKIASKLFATAGNIVRFSKTSSARDWTTAADAGFLPTGIQQSGAINAEWVGEFQKQLVVAFADGIQIWDVDPNPALITLNQRLFNVGSTYHRSATQVGGDLFFLSDKGFRSVFVTSESNNLRDSDIGSPIDDLVSAGLFPGMTDPISVYHRDQYVCHIGNYAWVYTYSRTSKVAAWSRYTFPFAIDDATILAGGLWVRSGDIVYLSFPNAYNDDGAPIDVEVLFSYLDFKSPGVLKQIHGMDTITEGTSVLSFLYDPRDPLRETIPFLTAGNTAPGALQPIELCTTHIAPRFRHTQNEPFSISTISFNYDNLGSL